MVNKRLHHLEIKLLIQYGPPELFSANSAGVWKSRFLEGVLPGHLNESVSCMAGAIKTRWILLHMKSEGGEEVAVNPLASLCLTDSIVLLGFPAAEDSPLRCRCAEERGRRWKEWARTTHRFECESSQQRKEMSACCGCVGERVERVWGWYVL